MQLKKDTHSSSKKMFKMEWSTKVTCKKIKDRDPVSKFGLMAQNMRVNGKMVLLTVVAD